MQFNRGRGRANPDDLRRRVVLLHDEILKLEQVLEGSGSADAGAADAAVRRLRSSIVQEELVRKRSELDTVTTEAQAAGIDVDRAIADDQLNRFAPSGALSGTFTLPRSQTQPLHRRRRPVVLGLAGSLVFIILVAVLLASRLGSGPGTVAARTAVVLAPLGQPVEAAPLVPSAPVVQRGETFFSTDLEIAFDRGRVYLTGDPPPDSQFNVDDGLRMVVTRPDGTIATWSHDFNTGCIRNESVPAQDVTNLFQPGLNRVALTLYDICGSNRGTTAPIWLVNRE